LLLQISSKIQAFVRASRNPELNKNAELLKLKTQELSSLTFSSSGGDRSTFQDRINRLKSEIGELEFRLGLSIYRFKRSLVEATPDQVIDALGNNQVLVDFLVFKKMDFTTYRADKEYLIALVVDKSKDPATRIVEMGEMEPISDGIRRYRRQMEKFLKARRPKARKQATEEGDRLARDLYIRLWEPLLPYLQDKETVFLSLDGDLHLLPFQALQDEQDVYLVQKKYKLVMLSTARELVGRRATKDSNPSAVFANPHFDSPDSLATDTPPRAACRLRKVARGWDSLKFCPLPGTKAEGENVLRLMKAASLDPRYFSDSRATEDNLFATKSPKILHVATHGFFLENLPFDIKKISYERRRHERERQVAGTIGNYLLRSGLALANANTTATNRTESANSDGIVTAMEILNLNLGGTHLVVLSACDTGVGEIQTGEGLFGLRRAFQEAGSRTVLSTLWSIADKETQVFMTRFYELNLKGMPYQQALRKVQREFIDDKQLSHPHYWAPFVMVGSR
ncbi:MAG: CHAT domain-containing protein, partial [Proteobacteria bacterium]|nr:CHAT domain-containing protein [Pseudomonadota bacterium]